MMGAKKSALFIIVLTLFLFGCASKKEVQKETQKVTPQVAKENSTNSSFRYINPLTYLDLGNQFLIELSYFWTFGMGSVEYCGDKAEETHRFLEDVAQSL